MKRYGKHCLCFALMAAAVFLAACAPHAPVGQEAGGEEWTFLAEGEYTMLLVNEGDAILYSVLSDEEYTELLYSLVDPDAEPDPGAVQAAQEDENAHLVSDILPDGRFLIENWPEELARLIEETVEYSALNLEEKTLVPVTRVSMEQEEIPLNMQTVETKAGAIPLPYPAQIGGFMMVFSEDETMYLLSTQGGMWQVSPDGIRLLSHESYEGILYEDLVADSWDRFELDLVEWNAIHAFSPDKTTAYYVSNRLDIDSGYFDLFSMDIGTREETVFLEADDTLRYIEGWITPTTMLMCRLEEDGYRYFAMDIQGQETSLTFEIEYPQMSGMKEDLLYYTNEENNILYIARWNGEGYDLVHQETVDGTLRIRGNDMVSPGGRYLYYLSVPDESSWERQLNILDLSTFERKAIALPEDLVPSDGTVYEAAWVSDDAILVTLISLSQEDEKALWLYCF